MQDYQAGARFEAHVSMKRMLVIALLALAFAILGMWFVNAATDISQTVRFVFFRDPFVLRVFGWVAIAIGVLGAAVAVRQLFRTGPVVEVDARGIRWLRWSDKLFPWSAITDASPRTMSGQRFLCLTLDRPQDYKSRSMTGLLAGMNKNMGFGDVAISVQGTDRSFDEFVEAVSRFRSTVGR